MPGLTRGSPGHAVVLITFRRLLKTHGHIETFVLIVPYKYSATTTTTTITTGTGLYCIFLPPETVDSMTEWELA